MRIKNFLLPFLMVLFFHPAFAEETILPTIEHNEKLYHDFGENKKPIKIKFGEIYDQKKFQTPPPYTLSLRRDETEFGVERFFDTKVRSCTSGVCFGMIPVPALYTQSRTSTIQFLAATSFARSGFILRIKF